MNRVCDGIADCPGKSFEDEHLRLFDIEGERIIQFPCFANHRRSCEEWWDVGARTNGVYTLQCKSFIFLISSYDII